MDSLKIFTVAVIMTFFIISPRVLSAQNGADKAWSRGDYEKAIPMYHTALSQDSTNTRALRRLGLYYAWQRDFHKSMDYYRKLYVQRPHDPEVHYRIGEVYLWGGHYASARKYFASSLQADSKYTLPMHGMARSYAWAGALGESEKWWKRAIDLFPEEPGAWIGLSQTLRWEGRPGAAMELWSKAPASVRADADAAAEHQRVDRLMGPEFSVEVTQEADAGQVEVWRFEGRASTRIGPWLALTIGVRQMDVEQDFDTDALDPLNGEGSDVRGGFGGATIEMPFGGTLRGGVGGVELEHGDEEWGWHVGVRTPDKGLGVLDLQYRDEPLLATPTLIANEVDVETFAGKFRLPAFGELLVNAGGAYSKFKGITENERYLGTLGFHYQLSRSFDLKGNGRVFAFQNNTNEGYFSPEMFWNTQAGVAWTPESDKWRVGLVLLPGVQQIEEQDPAFTLYGGTNVAYEVSPGRLIGVRSWATSSQGEALWEGGREDYWYRFLQLHGSFSW